MDESTLRKSCWDILSEPPLLLNGGAQILGDQKLRKPARYMSTAIQSAYKPTHSSNIPIPRCQSPEVGIPSEQYGLEYGAKQAPLDMPPVHAHMSFCRVSSERVLRGEHEARHVAIDAGKRLALGVENFGADIEFRYRVVDQVHVET